MAHTAKIPVIDISATGEEEQAKVAKELVDAAVEHGFVFIRNQGTDIPVDAIENAFHLGKKIFEAPMEEKQKCTIQKNNRGWSGMNYETLDPQNQKTGDFKEAFNFGDFIDGKAQQPLLESIKSYESEISSFYDHCYHLSLKLNHLLGIGLAVQPPTFFHDRHLRSRGTTGNILRFLYYPPLSSFTATATTTTTTTTSSSLSSVSQPTNKDVRAGAHSDYGSITLLFRLRGQAGLEVDTSSSSSSSSSSGGGASARTPPRWAPVPVCPPGTEDDPTPPVLVNIGDLLSYWTNGLLRSTVHRVVFPGNDNNSNSSNSNNGMVQGENGADPRYSIAFFCHPVGTTSLEPVPSERVRAYQPKEAMAARGGNPDVERSAITADEHLQMRLQASYVQLYEKETGKK